MIKGYLRFSKGNLMGDGVIEIPVEVAKEILNDNIKMSEFFQSEDGSCIQIGLCDQKTLKSIKNYFE